MTGARATLVERVSGALSHRVDRRGFLARGAIVGSALAVAPTEYLLRPTTAYAAVCSCVGRSCACGSFCCDGYTEFCCTIYGTNACPPGTAVAGWWKADGSGFCNGPRYYMDCNSGCGSCGCGGSGVCPGGCSGTGCGCAKGNCNLRRAGCNEFRYGQCNQAVRCLGPIVCRLVTCIPPWEIEPTCTHTVATDQSTAGHDAPCLHVPNGGIDKLTVSGETVSLTGWAVDNDVDSPINVDLWLDNHFLKRVVANVAKPDSVPSHATHGFTTSFTTTPGSHTLCAYGINVAFGSSNPKLACQTFTVSSSPFGHLESVTTGLGTFSVSGWAIDPDTTDPIDLDIWVDDTWFAKITADVDRPDIAAAYPAFGPDHGFAATFPLAVGEHKVCVYALNTGLGTANTKLACDDVTVGGNPYGHLESVTVGPDTFSVSGWAIDPDVADPVKVDIWVDGAWFAKITADINRPDVAAVHPDYGPDHGFAATFPIAPGVHTVCVYALNTGSGTSNTKLACDDITVGGIPFGHLESVVGGVGSARVTGWAVDPDVATSITVDIWVDGRWTAHATADVLRPDIAAAFPAYGANHGFDATVVLPAGNHQVCVYALNTGSGTSNKALGCKIVSVS